MSDSQSVVRSASSTPDKLADVASTPTNPEDWDSFVKSSRDLVFRALRAITEWAVHCFVVICLLIGFKIVHEASLYLWPGGQPTFLGLVSVEDLIGMVDFLALLAILVLGVPAVVKAYKGDL